MKTCTKCGEEKSEEEFNWAVKNERRRAKCKVCQYEYARKYYEENREKVLENSRKYKEENREKVLENSRKYSREYREVNREKILKYLRKYYEENREKALEYALEYSRKHRGENPQMGATQRAIRVSPLTPQELFCGIPRSQVNAEVRFDYILRDLLTAKTGIQHHVDHIKPLCEGGVHRMWNLAVVSADANLKKGPVWFLEDHLTDADIEAQDAEIRAIS